MKTYKYVVEVKTITTTTVECFAENKTAAEDHADMLVRNYWVPSKMPDNVHTDDYIVTKFKARRAE